MSYYRNYKKPYYHRRRHYHRFYKGNSFGFIESIFTLGVVAFILNFMSSTGFSNIAHVLGNIIIWAVVVGSIVLLVIKFRKNTKNIESGGLCIPAEESRADKSIINSEKHGCKCYMEELTDGEREVAHILAEGLNYKDYFIFNNIIIPSDVNGSSQIDHLVLSRFGIFVIENKDYKGWIFGDINESNWTQSLPGGTNKFQFQNPIHQNWSHIMSLRKLMTFVDDDILQNVVVFTGDCEIKTGQIVGVVHSDKIVEYITGFRESKMSENDLQLAIGKLSFLCQTLDISAEQHVNNLSLSH